MNKTELIQEVARRTSGSTGDPLTQADVEEVVNAVVDTITDTLSLSESGEVFLPGFGRFTVAYRKAREARNPQTGLIMQVPAKRVPKFKAAKNLSEAVDY